MKKITKRLAAFFFATTLFVPPVGVLAEESTGAKQLSERIQTGQPGDTITGDKIMIINTSDYWAKSGSLPATPLPGTESESSVESISTYGLRADRSSDVKMAEQGERPEPTESYELGETAEILNRSDLILVGKGEHSYIWLERKYYDAYGEENAMQTGSSFAQSFDDVVYYYLINACVDTSQPGWIDPIPYRDGTGMFHVVVGEESSGVAGAYGYHETQSGFIIKANPEYDPAHALTVESLLVHEGQHLLLDHFCKSTGTVIGGANEGLAVALAMYTNHMYPDENWLGINFGWSSVRAGEWGFFDFMSESENLYNYGYMQVRYLINQMGGPEGKNFNSPGVDSPVFTFFRKLYATGDNIIDTDAFFASLEIDGIESLEDATTGFFLALAAQEEEGLYGLWDDEIYKDTLPAYPVYYSEEGERVDIAPRAAILIDPVETNFVIPATGTVGYAIMPLRIRRPMHREQRMSLQSLMIHRSKERKAIRI